MKPRPLVSFGIPVRNGADRLPRAITSLLAQQGDIEIVISDNASDDGTEELCREHARGDPRIRYLRNTADTGQIANFNAVFAASRGTYFRWIGDDDWLHPDYVSKCVAALEAMPTASLVTTRQAFVDDAGAVLVGGARVGGVASPHQRVRLATILRLMNSDYLAIDPIYSLMRSDVLARTLRLQSEVLCDQILAVELILHGPYAHVDEVLAHRHRGAFLKPRAAARRYGVPPGRALIPHARMCAKLWTQLGAATAEPHERMEGRARLAGFYLRRHGLTAGRGARKASSLLSPRRSIPAGARVR